MPPLQEHYEHEETSLMMIDSLLACKGLEIDWDKLDEPLKQIGDGIDATKFGVDNGQNEDGERDIEPFTSRDWVFIKECIFGKPLPTPHAPEQQEDFVGRPTGVQTGSKEFLFDIVSNRHNGLDVDKIDYYHRDSFHAYGRREGSWNILLRDMCVARALCPNRNTCFKCKKTGKAGVHLMVCYPKKHIGLAQDFFATRMKNHATVVSECLIILVFHESFVSSYLFALPASFSTHTRKPKDQSVSINIHQIIALSILSLTSSPTSPQCKWSICL